MWAEDTKGLIIHIIAKKIKTVETDKLLFLII
jgi:hypothetical protein